MKLKLKTVLIFAFGSLLLSCNSKSPSSNLLGTWNTLDVSSNSSNDSIFSTLLILGVVPKSIKITEDSIISLNKNNEILESSKYYEEEKRIIISKKDKSDTMDYNINNDTLYITSKTGSYYLTR